MPIEFSCDRCEQKFKVPDDWAGRRVRCKGCNRVIKVPDPLTSQLDSSFNVGALKSDVDGPDEKLMTDFTRIPRASRKTEEEELTATCPKCGHTVNVGDRYSEVLCSNCWEPIPPLEKGEEWGKPKASDGSATQAYYDEILGVFSYPMGAMGSILLGMLVAGGAILLPVGLILMFVMGVALNPIAPKADVSWVPMLLAAMFVFEAIYFAGMAYSAMLDSARNTIIESDKPPVLTWNLATVGSGIIGYVTLVVVYLLVFFGVNYAVSGGKVVVPTSVDEVKQLMSPVSIVALALLTFTVPMVIVGLSMMPGLDGLSPGRIVRSITGTIVHYLFLFIIACFVLGIYLGITSSVMAWAVDALMVVLRKGVDKGFPSLLAGLLAWTVMIGAGFYLAFMMGRLHGLFARAFRRQLAFD